MAVKQTEEMKKIMALERNATRRILALEDRVEDLEKQMAVCQQAYQKLIEARVEDIAKLINSMETPSA